LRARGPGRKLRGIVLRAKRKMQAVLACLLATAVVAGCEGGFTLRGDESGTTSGSDAQASIAAHRAAAAAHERAAREAAPEARDGLLGKAAEEWYAAGETRRALRALEARSALPGPADSPVLQVLAARVELERDAPQRALDRVLKLARPQPAAVEADALDVEGRARFALGDGGGAVAALVARERGLRDATAIQANQRVIWEGLQRPGLSLRPPAGADATTRGWLELGELASQGDIRGAKTALLAWRDRYPRHPASATLVSGWLAESPVSERAPARLALVLPLSGRLSAAAEAVRDGFLTSYFADAGAGGSAPEVLVYDSEQLGPEGAYEAAVRAGAEFVVGPLAKPEVSRVAAVEHGVPVLALNQLGEGERAPSRFYQFGLAPEEEARQIAQRALADGHRNALVLVSADESGRRLLDSFRQELELGGGRVVDFEAFDPSASDHQNEIKRLLQLSEGLARQRALSVAIGETLEFEARPRQDADFIFLGALAAQARLLRPQLRFHFAAELPVYATSAVYEPHPTANEDLDGIVFADIPWLVDPPADDPLTLALREIGEDQWRRRARLYALGYDAYRLVPLLRADASLERGYAGATGWLTMEPGGRIHRQLAIAELHNGAPRPLGESVAGAPAPSGTVPAPTP
jgi:outer membrane PBP1 activator LpoA protein